VGQLREIAISDPRLAIAFLNGAEDLGEGGSSGAESVTTEIDIDAAIESVDDEGLVEVMELLRDRFQVSTFDADVAFDDDGRVDSVAYSLAYPSGGKDDVELQVELDVTSFDGEAVEVPDEGATMSYAEYMQI
jgi:hypothetical protein